MKIGNKPLQIELSFFMMEVPIIKKPVHLLTKQINEQVSIW